VVEAQAQTTGTVRITRSHPEGVQELFSGNLSEPQLSAKMQVNVLIAILANEMEER
jgi:hypothetical protein